MKKQNEILAISLEEYIKRQEGVERYENERINASLRLSEKFKVKWNKKKK